MAKNRILLQLIDKMGMPVLYQQDNVNKIHPITGTTIKQGDWQYKIVDLKTWNTLKIDHLHQYKFIDYIGWEIAKPEIEVTEIIPGSSDIYPEFIEIPKKKPFNTKNYTLKEFRKTEFAVQDLKKFLTDSRQTIRKLASERLEKINRNANAV